MILHHVSQSELDRSIETLVNNGQLPVAQEVIAGCGYTPEVLIQTDGLLDDWRSGLNTAQVLLAAQKQTTSEEQSARQAAKKEVTRFKRTARALFEDDETALRLLGIRPRRRRGRANGTNGSTATADHNGTETNGTEQPAATSVPRPSRRTTDTIVAWRRTMLGAEGLNETQRTALAEAKWPAERITATVALIDAWAQADDRQKDAMRAYRAQLAANKVTEQALRKWLKKARRLIQVSVDEVDPSGEQQLRPLLGV